MNKVDFTYIDDKFIIQCNNEDKMKDIISKFLTKIGKERKNIAFLYNGLIINEELSFNQCANRLDKSRNYMNVIVVEGQNAVDDCLKKSNYIICPQCNENAILSIKNFKLSITGCSKGHETKGLELKELEKTQLIDQTKIFCDNCHILKGDTNDNKLFICNYCKQNLCPNCRNIHNNSHSEYIKDFEENQFFCKVHFVEYNFYCNDCKKDICTLCQEEHKNHNITSYDSIIPDFHKIKENELKDTKEKIYELKTIINGMIYQLKNLNLNLDIYFEIYDSIISSYDINKSNYFILQNVNNMKNFNNNFLVNISEIIKDNNLKIQFSNILDLQSKIDFKRFQTKNALIQTQTQTKDNENISNSDNNLNNDKKDNLIYNNYENFNINKMKELHTFITKNEVEKILILNDGRIVTSQWYRGENLYKDIPKLCVYSFKNRFMCDINIDFEYINEWYKMADDNIIIKDGTSQGGQITVIKININNIAIVWNFGKDVSSFQKLSEEKFLIKVITKKVKNDENSFFNLIYKCECNDGLYSYDKGQLVFLKDIYKIIQGEHIRNICHVGDNEYIFYITGRKGAAYDENDYLIFYDIENNKEIKKLKVGKGQNSNDMILINKNNLLLIVKEKKTELALIDVKNKIIKNKFKLDIDDIDNIIILNENKFLYINHEIEQYEFEDLKTIKLKEKKKIDKELVSKYPGNKLLIYNKNKITIYG